MASLAEIRAKLAEQENRGSSNSSSGGDNAIYPFWNMKEGDSSTLRFLPDGNPDNTFFWVERLMIKLPFAGVKGQTDSRPVQVQVPCMEMYGDVRLGRLCRLGRLGLPSLLSLPRQVRQAGQARRARQASSLLPPPPSLLSLSPASSAAALSPPPPS